MNNKFWDNLAIKNKTTGYQDNKISSFDQLMRLKCTDNILGEYIANLNTQILLDFGCGKGDFSIYFSGKINCIYAFDISKEILRIAQNRNNYGNIKFINSLDSVSEKVDIVFSITVLQHILDDNELVLTLQKIHEKTNPHALFIALESIDEDIFKINQPAHLNARTFKKWVSLFGEGGFYLLESRSFYNPFLIRTTSYIKYEEKTYLISKLRKLLNKFHLPAPFINSLYQNKASAILRENINVDGIIPGHSFSKFFILKAK